MFTPSYSRSPYAQLEKWADELNTLQNLREHEEVNIKRCSEKLQQYADLENRMKEIYDKVGVPNNQAKFTAQTRDLLQLKTEIEETLSTIMAKEKTLICQINRQYPTLSETDVNNAHLSHYSREFLKTMIQEKEQAEREVSEISQVVDVKTESVSGVKNK